MGIITTGTQATRIRPRSVGSALLPAALGVTGAMALIVIVGSANVTDDRVALLLSYLGVWVPLLGAVAVASGRLGAATLSSLRLSVRPIDLIWGLGVGLLARTGTSLIEIWGYGSIGSVGARLGETVYDGWWLFGVLLAPVILAPFVEEVFFRGLVLRAVHDRAAAHGAQGAAAPIAIAVSGITFALMHLMALDLSSTATVAVIASSTLIFGLAVAWLALATGRIGGAIIAHITFNALVIVPALI